MEVWLCRNSELTCLFDSHDADGGAVAAERQFSAAS